MLGNDAPTSRSATTSRPGPSASERPRGHQGRYRLREQGYGSSVVNGRRFCKHHGIELDKATTFPAAELGDGIVGFRLGEADAAAESDASTSKPATKGRGRKKAAA